ncbi:MAG: DapH/DapD/GlmU-related protein [Candidatus Nezhaarchaeales archaeon]
MLRYISSRALVNACILGSLIKVYGSTFVGKDTIIDDMVILGYPTRQSLAKLLESSIQGRSIDSAFDEVSKGCIVGERCILRSGCVVYERVKVGDEVHFGHNVLVREDTEVGDHSSVGSYTIIEGETRIGKRVNIQSGVFIPRGTIICDDVFLGPKVVITNDKYPPSRRIVSTKIGRGAIIAANAIIVAGVEVGEESFIAAGSVVTRDVPRGVAVKGVPAKPFSNIVEFLRKREMYIKSK